MANETRKKRKTAEPDQHQTKRSKPSTVEEHSPSDETAGKIERIFVKNFMCHDALEINFNKNVNFIIGRNGSGKSAILTALVVGLGAKANTTSRGSSVKEFIKKGKNSASVEIKLINRGVAAYKPEIYGDSITVVRTIGSSGGYKIKNAHGEVVSVKKEELDHITSDMNIQVDNPISILNQDVSRTFLVTAGSKEKYELFMKATQLDKIGLNYKNAQLLSEEAKQKLIESKQRLSAVKKEIDVLQNNVRMIESINGVRAQHDSLNNEMHWAMAIGEERKLQDLQRDLQEQQNNVENHKEEIRTRGAKEKKINEKIDEFKKKVEETENEAAGSSDAYSAARKKHSSNKEAQASKYRELRSLQNKRKRMELDIATLRKEIQRQENDNNQTENETRCVKDKLAKLEEQLGEVEAMLLTKKTDQMHLESNKSHFAQEERAIKADLDQNDTRIRQTKRQLNALRQESGNLVTVFGPNMPRFLKRLAEEYERGKFKQMPRGPLGLHIKMKDPSWAAAVESFLGAGTLLSFCVDNAQDAKALGHLMKEVFKDEHTPQIISSKFYSKIHDVSPHCTRAHGFYNLLEVMEISDSVVANCLIDQREVECVLLIPTSAEACEMLSDVRKVPQNCKRGLTKQGDMFFPDPNYRSYGGRQGLRARFLQASATDAIKVLDEELASAEEGRAMIFNRFKQCQQNFNQAKQDLITVNQQISKLSLSKNKITAAINELRDQCEVNESNSVAVFTAEMNELVKRVDSDLVMEKQLEEEVAQLQTAVDSSEAEVKRCRDLAYCLDSKLAPIKKVIAEQEKKIQDILVAASYSQRRLSEAEMTLQKLTASVEIQQRCTDKAIAVASKLCPRINTKRSVNEINRLMEDLRINIETAEEQYGSKEEITAELEQKLTKYQGVLEFANEVEISNDEQLVRLDGRRRFYQTMKRLMAAKIQNSFNSVLALRKYTGSLTIDYDNRVLHLQVNPAGSAKRVANDARSLSGGERSYSTVAFILSLWDCIQLPFYFLDEFDVFMDKVNRRVIMDILLDHTRSRPTSQFAFLTPLDTSNILAEDYVTIHQLAPPERAEHDAH